MAERGEQAGDGQSRAEGDVPAVPKDEALDASQLNPLLRWLDRALSR